MRKYIKIFECLLVHLGYTCYRRWTHEGESMKLEQKRRLVLSLVHNKDSKPWTLSCGQSLLLFPSIVSKSSFNSKEWFSHVFTTAGLRHINLFSSALGMVCLGIKMIQTEYRLVSVGPACIPSKTCKRSVQACMSGVKGSSRGTPKEKDSN